VFAVFERFAAMPRVAWGIRRHEHGLDPLIFYQFLE
jgi:hypothetical protein